MTCEASFFASHKIKTILHQSTRHKLTTIKKNDTDINCSVYTWKSKNAGLQMCLFLVLVQPIIKIKGDHDVQKDIHSSPQFPGTDSG